jgi:4-amino-4-deoxy-L-arabinose transferase-like glycosyltransferase
MPAFHDNDPLWRLRHALAGLALALVLSVLLAALVARGAGDLIADSYGLRVALYSGLMLHVVAGAVVLFVRVARHETRPLSATRVLLWVASLWLWPLLLLLPRRRAPDPRTPDAGPDDPSSTA